MRVIVSGRSMEPSYFDGDRLFASKFIYRFRNPGIGDAVVLRDPRTGKLILKRIRNVQSDKYFVVGDNIKESTDSTTFGSVEMSSILGKVLLKTRY